jgi:hypothetical protein
MSTLRRGACHPATAAEGGVKERGQNNMTGTEKHECLRACEQALQEIDARHKALKSHLSYGRIPANGSQRG